MKKGEKEKEEKKKEKSETFHRTATRESYEFWKSIRNSFQSWINTNVMYFEYD